jgi:toxin YoeB
MRNITFDRAAFAQFTDWVTRDKRVSDRIITLINDISRNPFQGIGKPEPLKYDLKGWWSRRITDEHRLIYKVTDTEIIILSCHSHYDN